MNGTTGVPESVKKTPSISKTTTSGMSQYAGLTGLEHRYVLEFGDDARARPTSTRLGWTRDVQYCAEYRGRRTMAAQAVEGGGGTWSRICRWRWAGVRSFFSDRRAQQRLSCTALARSRPRHGLFELLQNKLRLRA